MQTLLDNLNWRYAAKQMNGEKVSKKDLDFILEAIRLSPTSVGLQAFKVLVIEDQELKEKLKPACNDQLQITQCSHLLIYCVYLDNYDTLIDEYMQRIIDTRGVSSDLVDEFKTNIKSFINSLSNAQRVEWAEKQTYLAMGVGLIAAAKAKVDSTPIEGFNPDEVDEILKLKERNMHSSLIMPIGYRDEENDFLVNQKKVRKPSQDLFEFL